MIQQLFLTIVERVEIITVKLEASLLSVCPHTFITEMLCFVATVECSFITVLR